MEALRKTRGGYRRQVTMLTQRFEGAWTQEEKDLSILQPLVESMKEVLRNLKRIDQDIFANMVDNDADEEDQDAELNSALVWRERLSRVIHSFDAYLEEMDKAAQDVDRAATTKAEKRFKLPKVELRKFSGELTEWVNWWSQFKQIHEDPEMKNTEKFFHLVQGTVPGSPARKLVDSFPQSDENYDTVIERLQERFGRKDLLTEHYVRDFIALIVRGVNMKDKGTVCLSAMYDEIIAKDRAMKALSMKPKEYLDVLLRALVESTLPQDVMLAWQRKEKSTGDFKELLEFMNEEVLNEQKRKLADQKFGFSSSPNIEKSKMKTDKVHERGSGKVPTAAGLVSQEQKSVECCFCFEAHLPTACKKASSMSYDDRKKAVRSKGLCFICLKRSHRASDCRAKVKCSTCNRRHETILCNGGASQNVSSSRKSEGKGEETVALSNRAPVPMEEIYLQTLVVKLYGPSKTRYARALLDSGAERSSITEKAATELGFREEGDVVLNHTLFGGLETGARRHKKYKVYVRSVTSNFAANFSCLDEPVICGKIPLINVHELKDDLKKAGVEIPHVNGAAMEIDLLIGADVYGKLLTGVVKQLNTGLTAIETKLGWAVCGKLPKLGGSGSSIAATVTRTLISCTTVEDLWNLDSIGIKDPAESKTKKELHEEAVQFFKKTVERENCGRYTVKLPWVIKPDALPTNKQIALKRLEATSNKLKTLKIWGEYDNVFQEWESAGIIEKVADDEIGRPCHYIPHRAVVKTSSATTKIRPVYDASCKSAGYYALNECLEKGENLLEIIPAVMHRFREKRIAVVSDIRKAFLQIGIHESDRDFLRFFWWEDREQKQIKVYRHCRVVFGVTCSPFLLGAVIQHHLMDVEISDPVMSQKLWKSFYVDNCVTSVSNEDELRNFHEFACAVMNRAGMELVEWHSTTDYFQEDRDNQPAVGVLGLDWEPKKDMLSVKWCQDDLPEKITKRFVLSVVQKIFDPLGFVAPVTVSPKLILQECWKMKIGWEDELPDDMVVKFSAWFAKMKMTPSVEIPRRFSCCDREDGNWSLHIFVDASQHAYAASVFLRSETESETQVQLVMAKSRVSPIKKVLIHRLELLSCLIGARLKKMVCDALDFHEHIYFWSDSAVALAWIRRKDSWGVFVGNRVREIHESSSPDQWNHVPGVMNPADLPSRGCHAAQLLESRWWEGPSWLKEAPDCWPRMNETPDENEVAAEKRKTIVAMSVTSFVKWHDKFSNFNKIVRVLAYIMRWRNWRNRPFEKTISAREIHEAELIVFRIIQEESKSSMEQLRKSLKLVLEDGLYRVVTKLGERDDTCSFKLPIVLPGKHRIVSLMLTKFHECNSHAGVLTCMRLLRERFWITKCRQALKKVISACPGCRIYTAKNYAEDTAMLPKGRVESVSVFETTGVDLAGPLFMKNGKKAWIVVFTCAYYRAIHLELVQAISTESFLFAFRRFVARRRRPKIVYSDQGTNFVGMANMLRNVDWKRVKAIHETEKIQWILNPPAAPWWGGFWERMIRVVKGLLIRILGKRSVDFEELVTVLTEVEDVVNSRPLTYISEESDELLPLSPNNFMKDVESTGLPDLKELCSSDLRGRYRYQQKLLEEFRSRFRLEYLGLLRQVANDKGKLVAKVGDLVLIGHEEKKRMLWPVGVIMELIPGRDGKSRVAKVKTASGVLVRPIQKLYCLESELKGPDVPKPEVDDVHEEQAEVQGAPVELPEEEAPTDVTTRSGRVVRKPDRFVP